MFSVLGSLSMVQSLFQVYHIYKILVKYAVFPLYLCSMRLLSIIVFFFTWLIWDVSCPWNDTWQHPHQKTQIPHIEILRSMWSSFSEVSGQHCLLTIDSTIQAKYSENVFGTKKWICTVLFIISGQAKAICNHWSTHKLIL